MRIKKLEISGFKSFAERARLHFGDGITGVVGPNGCGKSNVVDAIRWVMGEMSAKHLRGRGMQDVIFAGSDGRAAQSMAEVTLTFDNDGNVPSAYLSYGEIAVTRRLFRDGTSEYLINKSPVRLRDITDLFLGTGVGTRAYSIIEQGRIGFVVNSRPEERRSLIEEVAGITKFKVRKKAAERRMEATQQNLARVGDVVGELERQLTTLRRQAKKALAYRDLKAKLTEHELHQACLDTLRLHGGQKAQAALVARLAAAIEDSQRSFSADELAIETRRLALVEQEQALSLLQEQSAALDGRLAALTRDLGHWQEQARGAQAQKQRAAEDAEEAQASLAGNAEEAARLAAELVAHEEAQGQSHHDIDGASERVEEAQHLLAEVDDALADARRQALAQVQGAVELQAAFVALERELHDADARAAKLSEEAQVLTAQLSEHDRQKTALEAETHDLEAQLEGLRDQQLTAQEALPEARRRRQAAAQTAQQVAERWTERHGRLHSLRQIVARLTGYGDGVRTLYGDADTRLAGVRALVAELFEVPGQHERAIEAALGERLQYLVTDDDAVAGRAIARLRETGGGTGGFVPRDAPVAAEAAAARPDSQGEGILGVAAEVVGARPEDAPLKALLLGRVMLVRSLAVAQREARKHPNSPWRWVSDDGAVVDGHAVVTGGVPSEAGLLANRREVRELTQEVQALADQRQAAEAEQAQAEAAVEAAESLLAEVGRLLHARELEALELRKNLESLRATEGRHGQRLAEVTAEGQRHTQANAALRSRLDAARADAQAAQAGRDENAWRVQELEEQRQVQAGQLTEHQEALVALRVAVATAKERGFALSQARERLLATAPALEARIARAVEVANQCDAQAGQLGQQLTEGEDRLGTYAAEAEAARSRYAEARAAYESAQEEVRASEQAVKEMRRGEGHLQESLADARMQLQKMQLDLALLQTQVRERHDLEVWDVMERYHFLPRRTAEDNKTQANMERQLKGMGAINLTAIEDCAEVEQRFVFLQGQQQDLEQALTTLQQAILRINKTSRERFQQAFDAVNQTFQQVYPRLFHGGSARLELLATDDLLECGVDIIAMPPGKKLQNVSLLSGGEKALTATALVFAIFLIKPSPFCILDEVDAPLDEANVGRFNEMLREISKISQFIVITHNKQTMLQMDRLYGITMEDAGMSKVVAVDLHNRQGKRTAEKAA